MSSASTRQQQASYIAEQWGPTLTKAMVDKDISDFRNLFVQGEPVVVVLQGPEGNEAVCTIVDAKEEGGEEPVESNHPALEGRGVVSTLTWEEFREASSTDMEAQKYAKTEALCLGVLGDRMMMEVGRFNTDGQVYVETYTLLTFNDDGKVTMVETFTDPQIATVMDKATSSSA